MGEDQSLLAVLAHRWLNDVVVVRGLLAEVRDRLGDTSSDLAVTGLVKDCDAKLAAVISDLRHHVVGAETSPAGSDLIIDLDDDSSANRPPT